MNEMEDNISLVDCLVLHPLCVLDIVEHITTARKTHCSKYSSM